MNQLQATVLRMMVQTVEGNLAFDQPPLTGIILTPTEVSNLCTALLSLYSPAPAPSSTSVR
jgi:hypothetical protein